MKENNLKNLVQSATEQLFTELNKGETSAKENGWTEISEVERQLGITEP